MKDSASVIDADLSYAVRMVHGGFNTPEQAAQACGVSLVVLQARLSEIRHTSTYPTTAGLH